jgi:hypothetical protein
MVPILKIAKQQGTETQIQALNNINDTYQERETSNRRSDEARERDRNPRKHALPWVYVSRMDECPRGGLDDKREKERWLLISFVATSVYHLVTIAL